MMKEDEFIDRLSDQDLDNLIGKLCSTRSENKDVQIIDDIVQGKINIVNDNDIIEEDIINDIVKSGIPLSQEEQNVFKAKGIYDKYISKLYQSTHQEDNTMQSIEDEIRKNLEDEEKVTEVISTDDNYYTVDDNSIDYNFFQSQETAESDITSENYITIEDFNADENKQSLEEAAMIEIPDNDIEVIKDSVKINNNLSDDKTELNKITKDVIDTVDKIMSGSALKEALSNMSTNNTSDSDKEKFFNDITDETSIDALNDVPAVSVDVDDNILESNIMKQYKDVSVQDANMLINVMKRYKSGEKFSVYNALPESLKSVIASEAAAANVDKSMMEFFAKSFINDLVSDSYFDKEITDFNKELKEALSPMENITGSVMDEYSDEIYHKFTDELEAKANEIQEENPEKAEQLRATSTTFKEALSFERVKEIIKTPSNINRAYKTARDSFNKLKEEYNNKIATVSPSPRELKYYTLGLKSNKETTNYPDAYLNTLIVLIADTVINAINEGNLTNHIYAYYTSNAVYTIAFTANNSESNKIVISNIKEILAEIKEYMEPLEARNTRRSRKRNKRK